ncbi:hypothetical protein M8494_22435 [Serratia ureilytica]
MWLEQMHGKAVLTLAGQAPADLRADAVYSNTPGTGVCRDDGGLSAGAVLFRQE